MAYTGFILRIKNIRKHSNADRLFVGEVAGNTVIVDAKTKENELGVYFPTDGQLSMEYCTVNNLLRKTDAITGKNIGGYLDENKRHIRTLKLRKELSDGLFMPLNSLSTFTDIEKLKEGTLVDVLNGVEICKKYIPKGSKSHTPRTASGKKKRIKESYPLFAEHVDTKQLAYNLSAFQKGDHLICSLKMHGTSGRTSHTLKVTKTKNNWITRFLKRFGLFQDKKEWVYISGSRKVVLTKDANSGFYNDNTFRDEAHKVFEGKLLKGETVYYEIVGWVSPGKPIMGTCSNKKVDKDFVKKYGEKTTFHYGEEDGKFRIWVYRMTMQNEDGDTIEYPDHLIAKRCEEMVVNKTPELARMTVFSDNFDILGWANQYYSGPDPIGKTHIREGVVIRIENRNSFTVYKHKNTEFKILEGIIKDSGVVDMEEEQEVENV